MQAKTCDERILGCLSQIISYAYEDEREDFEDGIPDGDESLSNHIFIALAVVRQWLEDLTDEDLDPVERLALAIHAGAGEAALRAYRSSDSDDDTDNDTDNDTDDDVD